MHEPPRTRRSALRHASTLDVGLEVHHESSAVAYVPDARGAEVVFLGSLGTRPRAIDTLVRQRSVTAQPLVCVDEAGPCGAWLDRERPKPHLLGWVVALALVPKNVGDRVNTDRRDATHRARAEASRALKAAKTRLQAVHGIQDMVAVPRLEGLGDLTRYEPPRQRMRALELPQCILA